MKWWEKKIGGPKMQLGSFKENQDYDIERALELGYGKDASGHMYSRDYETGRILKSKSHETYQQALDDDRKIGYYPAEYNNQTYTVPSIGSPRKGPFSAEENAKRPHGRMQELPEFQNGTTSFPVETDEFGNTGVKMRHAADINDETGEAYSFYQTLNSLPEARVEGKLDGTNSNAVQNWSKEHDPIAYATRKGMNDAAKNWVGPGLAALTAPITIPAAASGLAAVGEATYGVAAPYVSAAWNSSLPGMSAVPGATVGNAINSGFAAHGATHIIPDTKEFIKDPSLQKGIDVGVDAMEMLPLMGPIIGTAAKTIPQTTKNYLVARSLSKQLDGPLNITKPTIKPSPKIDLFNKTRIGAENDFKAAMSESEYQQFLEDVYLSNKEAYDNPMVEYKGWYRPSSYFDELGSNQIEGLTETQRTDMGRFFKDKFCPPGSECAKSANSVSSKIYTDLTGKPFAVNENAHNAWHLEDQMTRHGGQVVDDMRSLKVGDRMLMGNEVDQSTHAAGYLADPSVRHAATYAGLGEIEGKYVPMVLESGKNNPMFVNPFNYTFTGPNSLKKVIRPKQFIGNETGKAMVEKNLRYAHRNADPVAEFSSNNETVQKLLTDSEYYKEWLKKSHDVTNDEFAEIVNSVIGVGAQETKLKGHLPGSRLGKAKVKLQDHLNDLGLTKTIKQTLNLGKRVLNTRLPVDKNLPKYPGASQIEMEAAKLSAADDIPFKEAVEQIRSNYQPKQRFTLSTPEPSKGPWRQKFQTDVDRLAGMGDDLKQMDSYPNAIGLMAENYKKAKQLYPDASPRELIDISTLMWNSPGKAANKELVDFYLFGKNNPNPDRFNFDYIRKVNQAKDELINVHPKGKRDPYYEYFRNGEYPEIQYKNGGYAKENEGAMKQTWWENKIGKIRSEGKAIDSMYPEGVAKSMGTDMSYPYRTLQNPSYGDVRIETPKYHNPNVIREMRMERRPSIRQIPDGSASLPKYQLGTYGGEKVIVEGNPEYSTGALDQLFPQRPWVNNSVMINEPGKTLVLPDSTLYDTVKKDFDFVNEEKLKAYADSSNYEQAVNAYEKIRNLIPLVKDQDGWAGLPGNKTPTVDRETMYDLRDAHRKALRDVGDSNQNGYLSLDDIHGKRSEKRVFHTNEPGDISDGSGTERNMKSPGLANLLPHIGFPGKRMNNAMTINAKEFDYPVLPKDPILYKLEVAEQQKKDQDLPENADPNKTLAVPVSGYDPKPINHEVNQQIERMKQYKLPVNPEQTTAELHGFMRNGGYLPKYQNGTPHDVFYSDMSKYLNAKTLQADSTYNYNGAVGDYMNAYAKGTSGMNAEIFDSKNVAFNSGQYDEAALEAENRGINPTYRTAGNLVPAGNQEPVGWLQMRDNRLGFRSSRATGGRGVFLGDFGFHKKPTANPVYVDPIKEIPQAPLEPTMAVPKMRVEQKPQWFKDKRQMDRARQYAKPQEGGKKTTSELYGFMQNGGRWWEKKMMQNGGYEDQHENPMTAYDKTGFFSAEEKQSMFHNKPNQRYVPQGSPQDEVALSKLADPFKPEGSWKAQSNYNLHASGAMDHVAQGGYMYQFENPEYHIGKPKMQNGGELPEMQLGTTTGNQVPNMIPNDFLQEQVQYGIDFPQVSTEQVAKNQEDAKSLISKNPQLATTKQQDAGTIDYAPTDMRSKRYVGNPNSNFMTPNLQGEQRANVEAQNAMIVETGLGFGPGLGSAFTAASRAKNAENVRIAMRAFDRAGADEMNNLKLDQLIQRNVPGRGNSPLTEITDEVLENQWNVQKNNPWYPRTGERNPPVPLLNRADDFNTVRFNEGYPVKSVRGMEVSADNVLENAIHNTKVKNDIMNNRGTMNDPNVQDAFSLEAKNQAIANEINKNPFYQDLNMNGLEYPDSYTRGKAHPSMDVGANFNRPRSMTGRDMEQPLLTDQEVFFNMKTHNPGSKTVQMMGESAPLKNWTKADSYPPGSDMANMEKAMWPEGRDLWHRYDNQNKQIAMQKKFQFKEGVGDLLQRVSPYKTGGWKL